MQPILSTIATEASKQKRPTKAQAFELLIELLAANEPIEPTSITASQRTWAKLYAYFLPPAPRKPRTLIQWIANAAAKNETYLRFIHVDEENIVATDGFRLHFAPRPEGMALGYYDSAGTPVDITARFPPYRKFIQRFRKRLEAAPPVVVADLPKAVLPGAGSSARSMKSHPRYHIAEIEGRWFNLAYLQDVWDTIYVLGGCDGPSDPILLSPVDDPTRRALVMPVYMPEEVQDKNDAAPVLPARREGAEDA